MKTSAAHAERLATNEAIRNQDRIVKELTQAGYTAKHASEVAIRDYPTPRQKAVKKGKVR